MKHLSLIVGSLAASALVAVAIEGVRAQDVDIAQAAIAFDEVAQQIEVEEGAVEEEAVAQPVLPEETIEQWIFGGGQNLVAARRALEKELELRLEELERICSLSEAQRAKLRLAGSGDMKRFMNRVNDLKRKFRGNQQNPNVINNVWQEVQPFQLEFRSGIFGPKSLFFKVMARTLDSRQREKFESIDTQRRREFYRSRVELTIANLQLSIPMTEEQRQALEALMMERTVPPTRFGQYDHYIVVLKMRDLPEEQLRPIFDDAQWKAMQQLFTTVKGMEAWLKQSGFLDGGEAGGPGVNIDFGIQIQEAIP